MDFLNFILSHWSAISAAILFVVSVVASIKKLKLSAHDSAKAIATRLMFAIEKKADEYLTSPAGADKFKLVVESGYALFSSKTRFFISKPTFEIIVQQLHDEAISFLEKQIAKQIPVVVTPIISVTPTEPQITV